MQFETELSEHGQECLQLTIVWSPDCLADLNLLIVQNMQSTFQSHCLEAFGALEHNFVSVLSYSHFCDCILIRILAERTEMLHHCFECLHFNYRCVLIECMETPPCHLHSWHSASQ